MEDISREEFTELFQSLELDNEYLANLLETTQDIIVRWKAGHNVPTRSRRRNVVDTLKKQTTV